MAVSNNYVSELFEEMAALLAIQGANSFRIRAYERAAETVRAHTKDVIALSQEELEELPGIGSEIAAKIKQLAATGQITQLEELKETIPVSLLELRNVSGLGPKRIKQLYEKLDITTLDDLAAAAEAGKIEALDGFGEKIQAEIIGDIERTRTAQERVMRAAVVATAEALESFLDEHPATDQVTVAGSYRRLRETVGDLDIVITSDDPASVMDHVADFSQVRKVLLRGETKTSIVLESGLQVDVRVVDAASYGAALQYFTGSKAHGIRLRSRAQERGLKINEYGVFRDDTVIAGKTEDEVYQAVDVPYIPPELREDRGEIQAAIDGVLPDLLTRAAIRGDLQCHTLASDGDNTLEEMVEAALALGYEYLAITDHSPSLTVAGGPDAKALEKRFAQIDRLQASYPAIKILKSTEVEILVDGSLDYPDDLLAACDVVIGGVHSNFKLSAQEQTERIGTAFSHPSFHILAHPTGRLINKRDGYQLDLEALFQAAKKHHVALELNASPYRLDLDDVHCKRAKEHGVKMVISTDAHSVAGLQDMQHGVNQARRGWLTAADVLNTRSWDEVTKYFYTV